MATALVGRNYVEAKEVLQQMRRSNGAENALRALENAKRRAKEQWSVVDERRLVVESAWSGKAQVAQRVRIHGRGRTGLMHRRWGKLWIVMRYITESDDTLLFEK